LSHHHWRQKLSVVVELDSTVTTLYLLGRVVLQSCVQVCTTIPRLGELALNWLFALFRLVVGVVLDWHFPAKSDGRNLGGQTQNCMANFPAQRRES
jgi:hypothetical protein